MSNFMLGLGLKLVFLCSVFIIIYQLKNILKAVPLILGHNVETVIKGARPWFALLS